MKIVTQTVNKALAREEANRLRAEFKAAKKNGEKPRVERTATLPTLPNIGPVSKTEPMPMLHRNDTMTTLPPYTSRPGTPGGMEGSPVDAKRNVLSRKATNMSVASYASYATSKSGYGRIASPVPEVPPLNYNYSQSRSTISSQANYGQPANHMADSNPSFFSGPGRFTESPAHDTMPPFPPPARAPSARPTDGYVQPMGMGSFAPAPTPSPPRDYQAYNPEIRTSSTSSVNSSWGGPQQPINPPTRSVTGPMPFRAPQRNMTSPMPRAATAGPGPRPSPRPSPNYDVESQRGRDW
ncbi:hypothetical protein CEP52_001202 [Fusarium oligoseptatum]|uniref:Uncharacterized protein n=2 Tax=Fusarium solani species complex TaxID=232080 RepID=A0A428UJR7_9HYPO|nr:hypothetical protein CEP52_001202 [Fusarium oligoseptatum]